VSLGQKYEIVVHKGKAGADFFQCDGLSEAKQKLADLVRADTMGFYYFVKQYYTDRYGRAAYRVLHRLTVDLGKP